MGAQSQPGDDATGIAAPAEGQRQGIPVVRVLAVVASLAITAAIIIFRRQLAGFAGYGYVGIFVVTLLGNATVILPVPSLLAVFAGGTAFNPYIVGLLAGVAEPLGELTGYMAGYGGAAAVENRQRYLKLQGWMQRHGFVTILVLSAIPNPMFDLAGISAGALRMPIWKFLLACWIGKTVKALTIAWLGSQSIGWLAPLLQRLGN